MNRTREKKQEITVETEQVKKAAEEKKVQCVKKKTEKIRESRKQWR